MGRISKCFGCASAPQINQDARSAQGAAQDEVAERRHTARAGSAGLPPLVGNARRAAAVDTSWSIALVDDEHAVLPINDTELAEALRMQELHDTRQAVDLIESALSAAPAPSAPPQLQIDQIFAFGPPASPGRTTVSSQTVDYAESFSTFQARLADTADYLDPQSRPDLIARFHSLVDAMSASDPLRDACFALAHDAIASCEDGIAVGLNNMELARIDHDAQAGKYDVEALLQLGEGFFKLEVLNRIALDEVARQQRAGEPMDALEIPLAYQVALRERLQLPGVAQAMRYARSAHVSAAGVDQAEQQVRKALEGSASVDFMAQWQPWRHAMQRAHPESYALIHRVHEDAREGLAIKPKRMSEGEWLTALDSQSRQEAADFQALTVRLTHQVLERLDTGAVSASSLAGPSAWVRLTTEVSA